MNRRDLLKSIMAASLITALPPALMGSVAAVGAEHIIKPPHLKVTQKIMLIAPARSIFNEDTVRIAEEVIRGLRLQPVRAKHLMTRNGYLAGTDKERADDINAAFADPEISGIFAIAGGWGSARTLSLLDYTLIERNPKVIMGYSDITALLNAIHHKTGIVTFHGPNASSVWNGFSTKSARAHLFIAGKPVYKNPRSRQDSLAIRNYRIQTIVGGKARGRLVGGNLSVFTSLLGTPYMPSLKGKILFLEDVGESIYRVDRMLNTLALAGAFSDAAGIVFGSFKDVKPDGDGYGNLALMDLFNRYCKEAGKPSFYGAMFGHIENNHTMPIGIRVAIDANAGSIEFLEKSVQ